VRCWSVIVSTCARCRRPNVGGIATGGRRRRARIRGAFALRRAGRGPASVRRLLDLIGDVLVTQHRMVGRVEVSEKPELLWERPNLERLYLRIQDEYERPERDRALGRKLDLVSETATTSLRLLETKRSLRVEWYIVVLILIEIVIDLYDLVFIGRGH
jgi:required for meiotic nuclear division protein 1